MKLFRLAGVALVAIALVACQREAPKESGSASGEASAGSSSGATGAAGGGGRASGPAVRPAAEAPPPPTPEPVVVPEGTKLTIALETAVSSGTSTAGDPVRAEVAEDVKLGERVVVPAGSEVRGKVVRAVPSGRVKGKGQLVVAFERLVVRGKTHPIEASRIDITAGSQHKKDAAIIGGGAAAGAVIGGVAKGGKGAGIGAVLGGVAGTGAVLATRGKEVELAAGTGVTIRLTRKLTL